MTHDTQRKSGLGLVHIIVMSTSSMSDARRTWNGLVLCLFGHLIIDGTIEHLLLLRYLLEEMVLMQADAWMTTKLCTGASKKRQRLRGRGAPPPLPAAACHEYL